MSKIKNRFIALLIVFTSIISFLPIQLGLNGQAANAITTQLQVSGTPTQSGDKITITNGEYITQQPYTNFTLSVDYKIVDPDNIAIGQTGVIDQKIIIKAIDGIKLNEITSEAVLKANNDKLSAIGCSISVGNILFTDKNGKKTIGSTITELPYGVNKIEYQIKETTVYNKGKATTDSSGKIVMVDDLQPAVDNYFPSSQTTQEIVIQHANEFVQGKIDPMVFDAYVGDTISAYNADLNSKSNKIPFLFSESQGYDEDCPLRYNFNVSDAVQTLKYTMNFKGITLGDTTVFKNGVDDTGNIGISGNSISGYLTNLGSSDLIVVKILDTGTNVVKTYAIQLKYTTLSSLKDYTLRDAGITKLNYNADSSVEAYIGKKFDVITENGVITYNGTITIDKRAGKINLEPVIGRKPSETAYKITNHYNNGSGIEESEFINNKQYVNFAKGTNNNEIWVEVYEGKDGNATGALLAVYKLKVSFVEGQELSPVSFSFDNNIFLTQPGRTAIADSISFTESRRTYNLNFNDNTSDTVSVTLDSPSTYDDLGKRREYIKAWGGTSVLSDSVTELTTDKNTTITIDAKNYKKILLQAYYDEIQYKRDPVTGEITSEVVSRISYPIGQKYTFYIAKNAETPDSDPDKLSSNASLSDIKVSNGNIKSTDGTSGFSSGKVNYSVTVPKIDTSSEVTIKTENSNAKDITATIIETGDEYGLTSGDPFEFPLNSSGKTNIKIVVTAQDGITKKTYNLTINNDTRSANALLKNVITDNGDFTFDPEKDPNKIRVDQSITKLKVSPVPQNSNSKVTVDGKKYSGSPITIDLKGSQKTEMKITVTSEDGSDSKTYYFEIYRTDSPLDDDDDNSNEEDLFYDEIDDCWVDTSKYEEWGTVNGKPVYFNSKGRQVKEQWVNTKGTWYYLNSKGYKATGWRKEVGGKSYYLDPTTGEIRKGWLNQNNKWYYLGLNGVMHKGWLYLNGKWYYFTPDGEMIVNQSMYVDGKVYKFGQDGAIY